MNKNSLSIFLPALIIARPRPIQILPVEKFTGPTGARTDIKISFLI